MLLPTKGRHDNSRACRQLTGMGVRLQNIVLLRSSSALSQAFILFLFQRCKCIFITSLKQGDFAMRKQMLKNFELRNSLALLGIHKINLDLIDATFSFPSYVRRRQHFFLCCLDDFSYGVKPSVVVYTDWWNCTSISSAVGFRDCFHFGMSRWVSCASDCVGSNKLRDMIHARLYLVLSRFWRRWKLSLHLLQKAGLQ